MTGAPGQFWLARTLPHLRKFFRTEDGSQRPSPATPQSAPVL